MAIGTNTDEFYISDIEMGQSTIFAREGGRWSRIRFSPDGNLLAASGPGGTVVVWDTVEGKEIAALKGHVLSVYALEFSPRGDLLVSGGMDGTVRLWGLKGWPRKRWGLVRKLQLKQP